MKMKILLLIVISVLVSSLTTIACLYFLQPSVVQPVVSEPDIATSTTDFPTTQKETSASSTEFATAPTNTPNVRVVPDSSPGADLIKMSNTDFIDENHKTLFQNLERLNAEKTALTSAGTALPLDLVIKIHDAEDLLRYYEVQFGAS